MSIEQLKKKINNNIKNCIFIHTCYTPTFIRIFYGFVCEPVPTPYTIRIFILVCSIIKRSHWLTTYKYTSNKTLSFEFNIVLGTYYFVIRIYQNYDHS